MTTRPVSTDDPTTASPGAGPGVRGGAEDGARSSVGDGARDGVGDGAGPAHDTERRILVGVLAVGLLVVGAWALAWPASFHADFPFERAWVALDGPYNEHLVRDVGALQLALGTVAALALRRPSLTGVLAIATLVFAVPHLAYHATHLAPFGVGDAVAQVVALAVQVLMPLRLLGLRRGELAGDTTGGRP